VYLVGRHQTSEAFLRNELRPLTEVKNLDELARAMQKSDRHLRAFDIFHDVHFHAFVPEDQPWKREVDVTVDLKEKSIPLLNGASFSPLFLS
jgi:hypothetical protein